MNLVVVERTMRAPVTQAAVVDLIHGSGWCNDLYGVSHLGSLLAPDRRTVICIYCAPDAEAVRGASRRLGAPHEQVWSATLHGPYGPEPLTARPPAATPGDPAAATVLVSRFFDEPVDLDALQARESASAWCLEAHRVRFLQTLVAMNRKRMLCLYAAPDAESVRLTQRQTEMPFDAVWPVTVCSP